MPNNTPKIVSPAKSVFPLINENIKYDDKTYITPQIAPFITPISRFLKPKNMPKNMLNIFITVFPIKTAFSSRHKYFTTNAKSKTATTDTPTEIRVDNTISFTFSF